VIPPSVCPIPIKHLLSPKLWPQLLVKGTKDIEEASCVLLPDDDDGAEHIFRKSKFSAYLMGEL
jgi:hypothetical protein